MTYSGDVTPCCFVKESEEYGFGALDRDNVSQVFKKRAEMQQKLTSGVIPEACEGCFTAKSIAAL